MRAMVLRNPGHPLDLVEMPEPEPGSGQVLIKIHACGVCRTDLHVVDGELTQPVLPLIPGHEIVGTVVRTGPRAGMFRRGDRTLPGGYAEYTAADERYCFSIPELYTDVEAAPLLCAGLIGYRSLVMAGEAQKLGMYGFGAAAHILIQVSIHQGRSVYAFTRPGDTEGQEFARSLGAVWAGDSTAAPPEELDAAIIFAPVGSLVPQALCTVRKGGVVVCAGIHMSDIPSFPYRLLWEERTVCSVANLTRRDGEEFMSIAPKVPVRNRVQDYPLELANKALADLRNGKVQGAAVLRIQ